jgi:hypothetical protein
MSSQGCTPFSFFFFVLYFSAVVLGPSLDEYQRTCELMMTYDENEDPEHIYKYKYAITWQSGIVFRNW